MSTCSISSPTVVHLHQNWIKLELEYKEMVLRKGNFILFCLYFLFCLPLIASVVTAVFFSNTLALACFSISLLYVTPLLALTKNCHSSIRTAVDSMVIHLIIIEFLAVTLIWTICDTCSTDDFWMMMWMAVAYLVYMCAQTLLMNAISPEYCDMKRDYRSGDVV